MSTLPSKQPPRNYRLGGFRITENTAFEWANRLEGGELDAETDGPTVKKVIFEITAPSGVNFRRVGEVAGHLMLVTHSEKFKGYKDMDSSEIPQFEEGVDDNGRDAVARRLLGEAGIREYEFATVLD